MEAESKARGQLHYLNNLKSFLIVLVVMHHSAGAYTVGEAWGVVSPERTALLIPLLGVNAAYFMGLFFLVSGFFVPASLARNGLRLFIWKKIQRLLIPALFVVSVITPLAFMIFVPHNGFLNFYLHGWWSGKYFSFGHMWFVLLLFLFSLAYALVAANKKWPARAPGPPGYLAIVVFALGLGAATTLVNFISPINTWILFHLVEPYHAPQYIALFIIGTLAGKNGWFDKIPARLGYAWLGIAAFLIISFACLFAYLAVNHYPLDHPIVYIWWGAFFCPAACTGLVVWFREAFNKTNKALSFLSGNAYGVYLIHIPFVLLLDKMLISVDMPVLLKFFLTALSVWVVSNILVWLIRLFKPMRKFV